jgi:alpha-galactosidase
MNSSFKQLFYAGLILVCVSCSEPVKKTPSSLADSPPMGWNSYNCFGGNVTEDEVKANADYMASNLKQFGWEYIVVDFLWYCDDQGQDM